MKNPFIFGKVVQKPQFINRKDELKRLTTLLEGHNNVLLLGDRRIGKTSLILQVLEKLKAKKYPCFYLNLDPIEDITIFIEKFSNLFTTHRSFGSKAVKYIGKTIKGIQLKATVGDDGKPVINTSWVSPKNEQSYDIAQVLAIPQMLAEKNESPFIIAIDEFQMISEIQVKGINLIGELRNQVMRSQNVNYLFLGSEISTLERLFSGSNEKFFSSVQKEFIGYIDRSHFIEYIQSQFEKRDVKTPEEIINFMCDWSKDIPATIQQLAAAIWDFLPDNVKKLSIDLVEQALHEEVARKGVYFMQLWKGLDSLDQRILQRMASTELSNPNALEFYMPLAVDRSTVFRHVNQLSEGKKGYILHKRSDGIHFCDPFFREWIKITLG
ncbi:MAG: ATP-binding protein [Pseudomonadota bacterium]